MRYLMMTSIMSISDGNDFEFVDMEMIEHILIRKE